MQNCPVCKSPLEPVAANSNSCSICGSVFVKDVTGGAGSVQPGARTVDDSQSGGTGKTAPDGRHIDATLESGFVTPPDSPPAGATAPPPGVPQRTISGIDRTLDSTPLGPAKGGRSAGNLDQTLDSAALPPGGIGRTSGGLDQTLDSATLPPGGLGRTAGGLDKTLDSAAFAAPPTGARRATWTGRWTRPTCRRAEWRARSIRRRWDPTAWPFRLRRVR